MHKRISSCSVCVLAMVLAAAATDLRAQDGQGYAPGNFAADQTRAPEIGDQPQMVAAGQPKAAENAPPDYSALPPAERQLRSRIWRSALPTWRSSWRTTPKRLPRPRPKQPSKPLIAPSGRIQMDVANFTQNAASNTQFGNAQNAVGFRRARLALLGEYEQYRLYHRDGLRQPRHQLRRSTRRTSPRPSRTCISRCGICPCWAMSASATSRNALDWRI